VFNETRTILEPAGAVAVAGVKAYLKARPQIQASAMVMQHV
jgi:threonine dehydratase